MSRNAEKPKKPGIKVGDPNKLDAPASSQGGELMNELHRMGRWSRPAGTTSYNQAEHGEFPRRVAEDDEYDDVVQMKTALVNQHGTTPFGQLQASDQDFQWMQRKFQALQYQDALRFVENIFDLTDPSEQRLLEEIWPDYYKAREEVLAHQANLQVQLATINLRGMRTLEDIMTVYGIKNGSIPLPMGPLWDPDSWYPKQQTWEAEIQRGLFNPKKLMMIGKKPGEYSPSLMERFGLTSSGKVDAAKRSHANPISALGKMTKGEGQVDRAPQLMQMLAEASKADFRSAFKPFFSDKYS